MGNKSSSSLPKSSFNKQDGSKKKSQSNLSQISNSRENKRSSSLPKSSFNEQDGSKSSNVVKNRAVNSNEIDANFQSFKKFDVVQDCSDHRFNLKKPSKCGSKAGSPSKEWIKRIQNEWKILQSGLPDMISVRVYEGRMDLLRAMIVGPQGTPYHNGLFFFDFCFPMDYPRSPPIAYYHSHGFRLNPNLYCDGTICLSLLNTWTGSKCEKWNSSKSTMLQVLVSIQALILNEKPYLNEPGHSIKSPAGKMHSLRYNEDKFIISCRTMLCYIRSPPLHFQDFIEDYFRKHGCNILKACDAYVNGAKVGSYIEKVDEPILSLSMFCESLSNRIQSLSLAFGAKRK